MKFLQLNFLPRSVDGALLVLRVWFGVSMLWLHGWQKASNYEAMSQQFADPFGFGKPASLVLAILGEFVCAGLLVAGLWTRFAALVLGLTMTTAFWVGHGARLMGKGNGELAFLYLGACVVLLIAGAGRFSADAKMGAKT